MSVQRLEAPAGLLFSFVFMGTVAFGVQHMAALPHVSAMLTWPAEVEAAPTSVQDDDLAVKIFLHQNASL